MTNTTPEAPDLRYPIGRYARPETIAEEQVEAWIDEIAALPADLRATVAPLTDDQLDTPYRPDGWTVRQVVHHLFDSHMNSYVLQVDAHRGPAGHQGLRREGVGGTAGRPGPGRPVARRPGGPPRPLGGAAPAAELVAVPAGVRAPEGRPDPAGPERRPLRLARPAPPGAHRAADGAGGLDAGRIARMHRCSNAGGRSSAGC